MFSGTVGAEPVGTDEYRSGDSRKNYGRPWAAHAAKYPECADIISISQKKTDEIIALDIVVRRAVRPAQQELLNNLNALAAERIKIDDEVRTCIRTDATKPREDRKNKKPAVLEGKVEKTVDDPQTDRTPDEKKDSGNSGPPEKDHPGQSPNKKKPEGTGPGDGPRTPMPPILPGPPQKEGIPDPDPNRPPKGKQSLPPLGPPGKGKEAPVPKDQKGTTTQKGGVQNGNNGNTQKGGTKKGGTDKGGPRERGARGGSGSPSSTNPQSKEKIVPCLKASEKSLQQFRQCPSKVELAAYYKALADKYHKQHKTRHCYDTYRVTENWQQFELCLLLSVEHNAKRLPNLRSGRIEAIGVSDERYNCYGYARNPDSQRKRWVGPRECGKSYPGDVMLIPAKTFDEIAIQLAGGKLYGWKLFGWKPGSPMPALRSGEERFILYGNDEGFTHGAYQNSQGIFAKMGELGVFKFESFPQMNGPAFGEPKKIFTR